MWYLRLWDYANVNAPKLLEDDLKTIEELGIVDGHQILAEARNADLTWPSELLITAQRVRFKDVLCSCFHSHRCARIGQENTRDNDDINDGDERARHHGTQQSWKHVLHEQRFAVPQQHPPLRAILPRRILYC